MAGVWIGHRHFGIYSLAVSTRAIHMYLLGPSTSTLLAMSAYVHQMITQKRFHTDVTHNCQKLETVFMSLNTKMNKYIGVYSSSPFYKKVNK